LDFGLLLVFAWFLGLAVFPAWAQTQPGKSLEEQLLDDRNAHPLDPDADWDLSKPAGRSVPGPAKPDSTKGGPAKPVPLDQQVKELQQKLARELGPAGVAEDENPLLQIARQMQRAESLLANSQPGLPTKQVQEQIVANLDKLLQSCNNSSCNPGGPSKPKPGGDKKPGLGKKPGPQAKPNPKPQTSDPQAAGEPAPRRDSPDVSTFKAFVPTLPQRDRNEIQESSIEEFLPKYRALIEAYYRDLAEELGSKPQE
jgi:hypothetical protein